MANRKKWTSDEKLAIVLEGFKGRPISEITREYGISDTQFYKWRDQGISALKNGLEDKRKKEHKDRSFEAERGRLLKKIGEQQMIIELQKKISESL